MMIMIYSSNYDDHESDPQSDCVSEYAVLYCSV